MPLLLLVLSTATCCAQGQTIQPAARRQIDAGNQAWVDGMKQGGVAPIIATYAPDAVDCSPAGDCLRGRAAIEQHMKDDLRKRGKAESARVNSIGSVRQGHFVYEWGQAEAKFPDGESIVDRYLTVWQEQADGTWKIFRNLVIPDK